MPPSPSPPPPRPPVPSPPAPPAVAVYSPGTTLPDNQKAVALGFAGANFAAINGNSTAYAAFINAITNSTVSYLVNTLKFNATQTQAAITQLTSGVTSRRSLLQASSGVTAQELVTLPAGTSGADATNAMNSFVAAAQSGNVFPQSFLNQYGITGIKGTVLNPSDTSGNSGNSGSNRNAVIIGCVVGILGAAIIAAVVAFVVIRRRNKMNIAPREGEAAAAT